MPINTSLAEDTHQRFRYCVDRGHTEFLNKADRCERFVAGQQWAAGDLAALKKAGRPALTINKINSTVQTLQGEQILNRSEVTFRPAAGGNAEVADALSKVWMQVAQNNQLGWVRSGVFDDGIIRSRGFYDVRLDFNDNMQGEVRIALLNSKNVVIDPDAEEYDPDCWNDVFVTKWLNYQDIAILYSKKDADYLKDTEGGNTLYGYDATEAMRDRFGGTALRDNNLAYADPDGVRRNIRVLERQHHVLARQRHFVDIEKGDTRPVPEGWNRERIAQMLETSGGKLTVFDKSVRRIRWTVIADNVVLHDDWSPYTHFTTVPYFPQFRYGTTLGVVEHLLSAQELLNKTTSQELHIVNTTANSGWQLKAGSLRNMSIEELEQAGSQTGLVLELEDINDAKKILPNPTPQGIDRLSYKAEEHIKSISNVSDSMQGFDREDVAAKAIAYKQQRSSVNHSKAHDNLERSDWLLARAVLDIVQVYYTEPRLINITKDDLTNESEQIAVNQPDPATGEILNDLALGEYHIVIASTPARATLEDAQFEQALAMRKQGVSLPDSVLIENSRLLHRAEIVKQMAAATDNPEAQKMKQMQRRQMELELAKLAAEVKKITADAGKAQADMQLKASEAQGGGVPAGAPPTNPAEMQLEAQKLQLEAETTRAELALRREELTLRREEAQSKAAFDQQKLVVDAELAQQAQAGKAALDEEKIAAESARTQEDAARTLREQGTPTLAPQPE